MGPERMYDVELDDLPPTVELIARLRAVGVKPQTASLVASWVELKRADAAPDLSRRTEVRYRKALVAAIGKPVPPRPGRAYLDQAAPLSEVGSATLVASGSMAMVALAVLAVLYGARGGPDTSWLVWAFAPLLGGAAGDRRWNGGSVNLWVDAEGRFLLELVAVELAEVA